MLYYGILVPHTWNPIDQVQCYLLILLETTICTNWSQEGRFPLSSSSLLPSARRLHFRSRVWNFCKRVHTHTSTCIRFNTSVTV